MRLKADSTVRPAASHHSRAVSDGNFSELTPAAEKFARAWLRNRPVLSDRMTRLLFEGDTEGLYELRTGHRNSRRSRSNARHALTCALTSAAVRAGWRMTDWQAVLLQSPGRGAHHVADMVRRKGHDAALHYVQRVWDRACTLVSSTSGAHRPDAVMDLYAARDRIASMPWTGVLGSIEMRVMMAHVSAAVRAGSRIYTLSYREVAEEAGCGEYTGYKAVRRLLKRGGMLRLVQRGKGTEGSTWALIVRTVPTLDAEEEHDEHPLLDGAVVTRLMGLDAFAHRGLGSSALKLVAALHARDRQTASELTAAASVSRATAFRRLRTLAEHGLVEGIEGLWQLTEAARSAVADAGERWDEIAARVGTYGTAWRRRQLHIDQRAVWRSMVLPRLMERRMPDVVPVRGDEPDAWSQGNSVVDRISGEILDDWVIASDGRLLLLGKTDFPVPSLC